MLDTIAAALPEELEIAGVPGAVVSVVEDGRVAGAIACGRRHAGESAPVTEETVFSAASLTKPLFAHAVLGLLDLDASLSDTLRLPEIAVVPRLESVTARCVLSHTSGMQNWRFESGEPLASAFAPGERFSYSGEGFFYLQRAVEAHTGLSVEALLGERVFGPLGMACSTLFWRPDLEPRLAWGHRGRGEASEPFNAGQGRLFQPIAERWGKPLSQWRYDDAVRAFTEVHPDAPPLPNNLLPNVAGSLLTTGPEYAAFLADFLRTAAADPSRLAPQVTINPALSWGLGWGLEASGDSRTLWQWGYNGVFENFALVDPERGRAVVILTNGERGLRVCERVVRRFLGRDHAAFLWI